MNTNTLEYNIVQNYITISEFKQWLEGYIQAGGNDISIIKNKLDTVGTNYPLIYPKVMDDYYGYEKYKPIVTC